MTPLKRTATLALCVLILVAVGASTSVAQVPSGEPTAEQVDAALRKLGMSRAQAESRARLTGVDLNTYLLRALQGSGALPGSAVVPSDTVDISEPPTPMPKLSPQVMKNIADTMGPDSIPYFGYYIFSRVPPGFEPSAIGPVDPEYLVGPEDVLRLSVWGQAEFQSEFTVDRDGRVFLPTVGQVVVSGSTLEDAAAKFRRLLSRSYSGLESRPPTVFMDLTITQMRPKRVYIMGEVEGAGGYTVNSYANVFRALFSVGGPTVKGSLRDIRVIRNNKLVATVDLYDYLTGASTIRDLRLQNNDIIFVPPRGKTVKILGEVNKPRYFELKEGEGLATLVGFAGGLLPTARHDRAQVERILPPSQRRAGQDDREVIDFELRAALRPSKQEFALENGDVVSIFRILGELNNYVSIQGAVWHPGRFEIDEVPTLGEAVARAGGLRPDAYTRRGHLYRLSPDRTRRSLIEVRFDSAGHVSGASLPLMDRDSIVVFGLDAVDILFQTVAVEGEVRSPGRYQLSAGMRVSDLVLLAGGFTQEADIHQVEIARADLEGYYGDTLTVVFNAPQQNQRVGHPLVGRIATEDTLRLQHLDIVFVRPNPYHQRQRVVTVQGEVQYPGKYVLRDRQVHLSTVIEWTGGPTRDGYLGGGRLVRGGARVNINMVEAVEEKKGEADMLLQDGDVIQIPFKPNAILVTGEVFNPGLQSFRRSESMWNYIGNAGGLTDSAHQVYLQRPDGSMERYGSGWFSRLLESDPRVEDGSSIIVSRKLPEPPSEKVDYAGSIKDTFAIVASALTIIVLASQLR